MKPETAKQVAALRRMTAGELRDEYRRVFGEDSRSGNRPFLFKRIAWRLQELDEGGLSERAKRRARELARDADLRIRPPRGAFDAMPALATGRLGIRPRFGAVGKYGSLAVIERFMRTMKSECTRRILVSLRLDAMRSELAIYAVWYNQHRPSQALGGRTPCEVYADLTPAIAMPRFEPRSRWPVNSPCASPQAAIREQRGTELFLVVGYVEGRRHLPVIELRSAA